MSERAAAARHAFTEQPLRHEIAVNGLGLVAWEWPGEGDPILLVHATGFHARCWQAVVEALPGRRIVAPDMPSHGQSGRKTPPYDWIHFGEDLLGVVEALGLRRVLGVGHSMGGMIGLLLAATVPERVRRIVTMTSGVIAPSKRILLKDLARLYASVSPTDFFRLLYQWLFS